MKQILKLTLILVALLLPCSAGAQQQKEKMSREELAATQARHIASELAFNDDVAKKFIKTYCDCQNEIWSLGPATIKPKEPLTEEQARQAINHRFDYSQKALDIRRKYYGQYSKFLTQLQIERVYQLEKKIKNRLGNNLKKRTENMKKRQDLEKKRQDLAKKRRLKSSATSRHANTDSTTATTTL